MSSTFGHLSGELTMSPDDEVTRIEWRYLDEEAGQ